MSRKTLSDKTIKLYLDYLSDAFLIEKSARYNVNGKKYIDSPSKYYFEDVGLRNARLNFRQQEENHIMENIIYTELRSRGYRVDVGVVESYETDHGGKSKRKQLEIDFIANKGNRKYYIQSVFEMLSPEKIEQEKKSLNKLNDSFKKFVIIKEDIKRENTRKYRTLGLSKRFGEEARNVKLALSILGKHKQTYKLLMVAMILIILMFLRKILHRWYYFLHGLPPSSHSCAAQ